MKRQPKDEIFEILYRELGDEMEGASLIYVNDGYGWKNWYKDRLLRLCVEYRIKKNNHETSQENRS